jgi:hypothetical protein
MAFAKYPKLSIKIVKNTKNPLVVAINVLMAI